MYDLTDVVLLTRQWMHRVMGHVPVDMTHSPPPVCRAPKTDCGPVSTRARS